MKYEMTGGVTMASMPLHPPLHGKSSFPGRPNGSSFANAALNGGDDFLRFDIDRFAEHHPPNKDNLFDEFFNRERFEMEFAGRRPNSPELIELTCMIDHKLEFRPQSIDV